MANLLDQIGQRNVVRVVSNGVPSNLSDLTDVDFSNATDGSVPVYNGAKGVFQTKVENVQLHTSGAILTVDPVTGNTAFTDTIDAGFF